ncbi:DNA/RNA nuclease SfsA [Pelagovum pacificum]|uniref:Sugar fermentation stimulation protein homolog n=1 Tax=Pelagovum pacificum TaxID=2588711 RepID=A0A5C5GHG9_9RHOB|nr:DNA/RNA nuclease SfsA [Pelagovum pacificum]QQA42621.1 DNA/RNA nuclease SfsA [Pelagovum pacificum]TNY34228.1 DNA/RNA nuclease SfsA [Pelagovum pacificum]
MRFSNPLVPATLVRRYKRFLADVALPDGRTVTAHCPNPGAMTGLAEPGTRVWLEPSTNPKSKLDWGWRLTELADGTFAGIDTGAANRVVAEALNARTIDGLPPYDEVRPEVAYGEGSRVDFRLSGPATTWLEVKSVTLSRTPGLAEFPDTVTARGARHLRDLATMAGQGDRAVLLFLVQRTDATHWDVAADIDPAYAAALEEAERAGVEVLCFDATMDQFGVTLADPVPRRGSAALDGLSSGAVTS